MKRPKILFFGTPDIAIPTLQALAKLSQYEIVGVGVFPDRKIGRKQTLTPCPVKIKAQELSLPVIELPDKESLIRYVERTDFDLGIVIAFGMIFPATILESRKMVNIHFSLLPSYRGASPVQSAILNSEDKSGISWQVMQYELDAGDIIYQVPYSLTNKTTAEAWFDMSNITAEHTELFLSQYFKQKLTPQPQDDSEATFCGKFKKTDGEIFPLRETATDILNKFRAFTPWPGIYVETSSGRLKILDINKIETPNSVALPCLDNHLIYIERAQLAGKKPSNMTSLLRGHPQIFDF